MVDFLSSPILFPSDLDDSLLLADPTFKLPPPVNWTDYTYFTMVADRLSPHRIDTATNTILSFVDDTNATTTIVIVETTVAEDPRGHSYPGATKSKLDQFIPYAHHLPRAEPKINSGLCHDAIDKEQYSLPVIVYGVLGALEKDNQQNAHNPLLSIYPKEKDDGDVSSWLLCDDTMDTPDLVYSVSSPSLPRSLASDDSAVPLAGDISSHKDTTRAKWIIKANQVKQSCVKSLSYPTRKLCKHITL